MYNMYNISAAFYTLEIHKYGCQHKKKDVFNAKCFIILYSQPCLLGYHCQTSCPGPLCTADTAAKQHNFVNDPHQPVTKQ